MTSKQPQDIHVDLQPKRLQAIAKLIVRSRNVTFRGWSRRKKDTARGLGFLSYERTRSAFEKADWDWFQYENDLGMAFHFRIGAVPARINRVDRPIAKVFEKERETLKRMRDQMTFDFYQTGIPMDAIWRFQIEMCLPSNLITNCSLSESEFRKQMAKQNFVRSVSLVLTDEDGEHYYGAWDIWTLETTTVPQPAPTSVINLRDEGTPKNEAPAVFQPHAALVPPVKRSDELG